MHLLWLVLLNPLFTSATSLTTEYYLNLINQNIKNAETYKLPENNEEFRKASQSQKINDCGTYDFIIVGAGSSGSVLATRLSEIDEFSVLLLEAGGEEDDFTEIMAYAPSLQMSDKNWGYYTTVQNKSCLGMVDQKCNIARGKSIGGSGAINAMMYIRGNHKDYDKWAELGNTGWSYKDVLSYFKKSENLQIKGDSGYHGIGGLWNIEYHEPPSLLPIFFNAHSELNVSHLDYNGRNEFGVSQLQVSLKYGKRQSSGKAFLEFARKRSNLNVLTNVLVTKLTIDSQKVVQGVEFLTRNEKCKASAKKEVIVSAGVINTPQLLMLSGVGPRDHLDDLGIPVIVDLPVGKNLQDHPMFPLLTFRTNSTSQTLDLAEYINMYLKGVGPLTKGFGVDAVGFISTRDEEVPTIEYLLLSGVQLDPFSLKMYNYNTTIFDKVSTMSNSSTDFQVPIVLLHGKSRGQITLKSTDPIDFPNIDLNIFDIQEDVDVMIEGVEFILKLFNTEPFRAINATLREFPICTEFKKLSKKNWECILRHLTATIFHPSGTTRMGPDTKTSVVDCNLKIHGLKHVRIVDAGVFPTTISGHTNAPAVMVAEKIADSIKTEYGCRNK